MESLTASGALAMIFRANASAVAIKSFFGTTQFTRPMRSASWAVIGSPVRIISSALPFQPGKPLRAPIARDNSNLYFRLSEAGIFRSYTQRASHGKFAPSTEGVAVNHRNDRLSQIFDQIGQLLAAT